MAAKQRRFASNQTSTMYQDDHLGLPLSKTKAATMSEIPKAISAIASFTSKETKHYYPLLNRRQAEVLINYLISETSRGGIEETLTQDQRGIARAHAAKFKRMHPNNRLGFPANPSEARRILNSL